MCLQCKKEGREYSYWDETSTSLFERGNKHIEEGEQKLEGSHIYIHMKDNHPELKGIRDHFKFRVVAKHKSAFVRQLYKVILIKNSKAQLMNGKLMYDRCVIPDVDNNPENLNRVIRRREE